MMSQKVLIYVALVVLIVQVAVTSAGTNEDCKCAKFDPKGNCLEEKCPCVGKKCTPQKGRTPAGKASTASKQTSGSKPAQKAGTPARTPLGQKNTNTQPKAANGRPTARKN